MIFLRVKMIYTTVFAKCF